MHLFECVLMEWQADIASRPGWWCYPCEEVVRGFMGTGKLFIVGDQPSTSSWSVDHPHRRAFYDLLAEVGAGNAHLTDLYKRRGSAGDLKRGLPSDFDDHLKIFR